MRSCRPIFNRFWLTVRFVPNYIRSKVPSIRLQGKSNAPWHTDKVFRLEAFRCWWPIIHFSRRIFFISCTPSTVSARVGIADIQPESAINCQNSSHFNENFSQVFNVTQQFKFSAYLVWDTVISQTPIRWTSYTASEGIVRIVF